MGTAEDFIASFFKEHPEARSGDLTMDELNALVIAHQLQKNSRPLDDFDGISPDEMNGLLYTPLAKGGIIELQSDFTDCLDRIPLFQLSEMLMMHIQKVRSLKLTAKGNLPIAVCELLYSQNLIEWEYMKYITKVQEDNIPYIWPLKHYLLSERIVKKRHNTISLTKYGNQLMLGPRSDRFLNLFAFFTYRFHWGNFFRLEDQGRSGHFGWAYSLYLLSKYGNAARASTFYSMKLIKAFEHQLWVAYQKNKDPLVIDDYQSAYAVRFFENFAQWFGLVKIDYIKDYRVLYAERNKMIKSDILDQLFKFKAKH